MVSRFTKGAAVVAATATLSTFAFAQYGSGSSFSSPAPVQSYGSGSSFSSPAPVQSYGSSASFSSPAPVQSFNSSPSYVGSSVSNTFAGVASPAYADATYGTGSISNSYEGSDVEIFGFSGTPTTVPGLGHNESLRATDCPTNVYNPDGGRVLGCYNVVKPVAAPRPQPIAQTTYYRVVRPVIYVRYPVYHQHVAPRPVVQPCCAPSYAQPVCKSGQSAGSSRYGAQSFQAPQQRGCGW